MALSFSCNIQGGANKSKLVALGKHNYRKFEESSQTLSYIDRSLTHENEILIGTDNVLQDLQEVYKKEFSSAIAEYNMKQTRSDRKILDYFEKVSQDKKTNLYSSVVLQYGDKEFWQGKSIEEKRKAIPMLKEQLKLFQASFPNFKIASAVIHMDETSPHVQIIGVGVKNYKTGLTKRVSQKNAFGDRKNLRIFQELFQKKSLEIYNDMYQQKEILKEKTGRRFRYSQAEYIKFKENLNKALEKLDGQAIGNRVVLKKEEVEEVKEILKSHTEILGTVVENKKLRKQLQEQEEVLQQLTDKKEKQIDELEAYFQEVEESKKRAQEQLEEIEFQLQIDRRLEEELQQKNLRLKRENDQLEKKNKSLEKEIEEQNRKIKENKVVIQEITNVLQFKVTSDKVAEMKKVYAETEKKMELQEQKIEKQNEKIEKQLEEKYTNIYNRVMKKQVNIVKKSDMEELLNDVKNYKEFINIVSNVADIKELFRQGKAQEIKKSRVNSTWSDRVAKGKNRGRDW